MTDKTNIQRMDEITKAMRDPSNMDPSSLYGLITELRALISAEMLIRTEIDALETIGCACPDVEDLQPECPIHGEEPLRPGTITDAGWLVNDRLVKLRTSKVGLLLEKGQEHAACDAGWVVKGRNGQAFASRTLEAADAYDLAMARGFTYWPGIDPKGPVDWDGGNVLRRGGYTGKHDSTAVEAWTIGYDGARRPGNSDVIGYHKREAVEAKAGYASVSTISTKPLPEGSAFETVPTEGVHIIRQASRLETKVTGMPATIDGDPVTPEPKIRNTFQQTQRAEKIDMFALSASEDDIACRVTRGWIDKAAVRTKARYDFAADMMAERERRGIADGTLFSIQAEMLDMLRELVDIEGPQPGDADWGGRAVDLIARAEKLV